MERYRIFFSVICLGVLGYFLQSFLIPMALGVVFSLALYPFYQKIPLKKPRLKINLFVGTLTSLVLLPIFFLIARGAIEGKEQFSKFEKFNFTELATKIYFWLDGFTLGKTVLSFLNVNVENLGTHVTKISADANKLLLSILTNIVTSIPLTLFNFSVIISTIYVCLSQGSKFVKYFQKNMFYSESFGKELIHDTILISKSVVLATIGSAIVQSFLMVVPTLFINFDSVLIVGFATFLFSFIPVIGTSPVTTYLVLFYYLNGNTSYAISYLIFGLILGTVDNFIRAKIIGDNAHIHPMMAFFATIGGLQVMGFWGIFLGPVCVVVSFKILSHLFNKEK